VGLALVDVGLPMRMLKGVNLQGLSSSQLQGLSAALKGKTLPQARKALAQLKALPQQVRDRLGRLLERKANGQLALEGVPNEVLENVPNQSLQMRGGTTAQQLQNRQTLLQNYPVLSGYSQATQRLMNATPGATQRLMKINPKVLKTVLSDSKLLDRAVKQAEAVNNVVGKKWSKLNAAQQKQLNQFYRNYTTEKGTPVLAQHQDVGLQLHVDKNGVIVEGLSKNVSDLRISTDQMRKILKDNNVPILKDHSIHHKLPIAAGESDPLVKGAIELDGYDINNAANLKQLPRSTAARSESPESKLLPEHGQDNYHPKWNAHTKEVLRQRLIDLRKEYKIPENLSKEEAVKLIQQKEPGILRKTLEEAEKKFDGDLLKDDHWIRYNSEGERVLSFNEPQALQGEKYT
jgi:hypothetical protein